MSISKLDIAGQVIRHIPNYIRADLTEQIKRKKLIPRFNKTKGFVTDILDMGHCKAHLGSEAAKFFGVQNQINIMGQIINHGCLSFMKSQEHGILQSFPSMSHINCENLQKLTETKNLIWQENRIEKLFDYGAAKMSFTTELFGKGNGDVTHTIGIVTDSKTKTIYVLDSIPEFTPSTHDFRKKVKFLFTNPSSTSEIENIVFSTKPQQTFGEYTCNNWTYANIEAVKTALKEGKILDNSEQLNSVLPDDINTILDEQKEFVLQNMDEFMAKMHRVFNISSYFPCQ